MASTIKLKNGSGAPTAGDLVQGEPALDLTNKRLYTEDAGGTVVEVGTNPTALTIGGTALTATATELNVLDGITATTAELNYTDGVTSNIQTQLNTKAPIASPTFTGTTTIPTADINGGTIDDTVIGGTTAAAGSFTTLNTSGSVVVNGLSTFDNDNYYSEYSRPSTGAFGYIGTGSNTTGGAVTDLGIRAEGNLQFSAGGFGLDMTLDSSGNVGIGTSSPANPLSVTGSSGTIASFSNAVDADLLLKAQSGVTTLTPSTGVLAFGTSSTERMRLDDLGNLLVGTTSLPSAGSGGVGFQPTTASRTIIRCSTSVTTSAGLVIFQNPNGEVGSISTNGSTVAYNTSSDERLKENITDAPAGNIDDIKVRSFDWKVDGSHQEYGMVAQELESVAPYAVTKGETEDDMWSVDYSKLVPMLIKEVQSLRARVAQLEGAN